MEEYKDLISVPVITFIVYVAMEIIKSATGNSEIFKRLIPLLSATFGIVCAIVAYYAVPGIINVNNAVVAAVIGATSGLSATGANQIFKQFKKNS